MGKARRHQQLLAVLETQLDPEPLAIGGRALANINRHIEQCAAPAAHQLVLRMGRGLKMEPANCARRHRQRMVVLHKRNGDPAFLQRAGAIALREKPPMIAETRRRDNDYA